MKAVSKFITGAAAAALLAVSATPAQANHRRDRDCIAAAASITCIAVLGRIAAISAAVGNDGSRYGSGYRNRYRDGYTTAVNACGREADRYGRGRVQITDVDRRGNDSYRVRGVIEA